MFIEVFNVFLGLFAAIAVVASLVAYYAVFLPEYLEDTESKVLFILIFLPYFGWILTAIELYREIGKD